MDTLNTIGVGAGGGIIGIIIFSFRLVLYQFLA
jgi:hypothetical protein